MWRHVFFLSPRKFPSIISLPPFSLIKLLLYIKSSVLILHVSPSLSCFPSFCSPLWETSFTGTFQPFYFIVYLSNHVFNLQSLFLIFIFSFCRTSCYRCDIYSNLSKDTSQNCTFKKVCHGLLLCCRLLKCLMFLSSLFIFIHEWIKWSDIPRGSHSG